MDCKLHKDPNDPNASKFTFFCFVCHEMLCSECMNTHDKSHEPKTFAVCQDTVKKGSKDSGEYKSMLDAKFNEMKSKIAETTMELKSKEKIQEQFRKVKDLKRELKKKLITYTNADQTEKNLQALHLQVQEQEKIAKEFLDKYQNIRSLFDYKANSQRGFEQYQEYIGLADKLEEINDDRRIYSAIEKEVKFSEDELLQRQEMLTEVEKATANYMEALENIFCRIKPKASNHFAPVDISSSRLIVPKKKSIAVKVPDPPSVPVSQVQSNLVQSKIVQPVNPATIKIVDPPKPAQQVIFDNNKL